MQDVPFLAPLVRHIVGANRFSFAQRTLVIDTLPNPNAAARRDPGPLVALAESLRAERVVDCVLGLGELQARQDDWSRKHFGRRLRWNRDYRGVPLFGCRRFLVARERTVATAFTVRRRLH